MRDAIKRIKEQDTEIAREQVRKEAEAEADELSNERYELAEEIEGASANLSRLLGEYEALHRRHTDALSRAGRPLDYGFRLYDIVTGWWRHRFGGWNSLTSTPSPHFASEDVPLYERDLLASPGQDRTSYRSA